MAKRFVNPDWKLLRKLSPNLQRAYFYCWDKADACGVYVYDQAYLKVDLGVSISLKELGTLPGAKILTGERIFFTDFIETNYGSLKEGYNPHKPVYRALEKNQILSLNQACFKLEEEGEDEEEEKDEEEGEEKAEPIFEKTKVVNPFGENFKAWEAWKEYKLAEHRQRYKSPKTEQTAINKLFELARGNPDIAQKIIEQSIANQYQGLFQLKENYGKQQSNIRDDVQEALNKHLAGVQQTRA